MERSEPGERLRPCEPSQASQARLGTARIAVSTVIPSSAPDLRADLVLHQPVEPERERHGEREVGEAAESEADDDDGDETEAHGAPLQGRGPLTQEDDAEADRDERVEVVAEGDLDEVAGVDAVDERRPVDCDEHGRQGERYQNVRPDRTTCQVRAKPRANTRRIVQNTSAQITRCATSSRAPVGAAAAKSRGGDPRAGRRTFRR